MSLLLTSLDSLYAIRTHEKEVSADFIDGVSDLVSALRGRLVEIERKASDFEVTAAALGFFLAAEDKAGFLRFLPIALDLAGADGSKLYRVASRFYTLWLLLRNSDTPLEKDILVSELAKRFGDDYVSALMAKMASRNMNWTIKV